MFRTVLAMMIGAIVIAGCTTNPPTPPTTQPAQHAECLVCKRNADLACVDVLVDPSTPQYDYDGRTYYFCSEECKSKFVREPGKYVQK